MGKMIGSSPLFVCFVTTIRTSEPSDWGIHLVAGLGSHFLVHLICRFEIHPFIVRNWRKATKGSIRVNRKYAQ
jgi:hypothetical protein